MMKVYNWEDIPEESPRPGVTRKAIRSANAIVVRNVFQPKIETFPHRHNCDQLATIVSGRVIFHVGDEQYEMGPGSICLIPPDVVHFAEPVGDEPVVNIDVFSPVREDYLHMVAHQEEKFES